MKESGDEIVEKKQRIARIRNSVKIMNVRCCDKCKKLYDLYVRTPRTDQDYWLMTELFAMLHNGDYCQKKLVGPGSITCDRAGPVTEEGCKHCIGTGGCRHGKTEEEFLALKEGKG